MTQTYLIPQYLYDYVYPFTLDNKFHRIKYNSNFPKQGQQWLNSIGFDSKYLFYAVKKGHKHLPATCIACGKPLTLNQLKLNKCTGKYCSSHCSNNSEQAKNKRAQTNLQRYGTTNPNELDFVKQRKLETINKKGALIAPLLFIDSTIRDQLRTDQGLIRRFFRKRYHH